MYEIGVPGMVKVADPDPGFFSDPDSGFFLIWIQNSKSLEPIPVIMVLRWQLRNMCASKE